MTLLPLMKAVELFHGLTDAQLQRLLDISQEVVYHDGDVIFEQGAAGDALYFISEGQVEICIRCTPGTAERTEVFLGRGQIFGEMALVDRGTRSATVRCCQDDTILRVIQGDAFTALCEADTAIGYVIMRNIACDLSFKLRHRNLNLDASSQGAAALEEGGL
jgi:CRP-like cAMP-binding protein